MTRLLSIFCLLTACFLSPALQAQELLWELDPGSEIHMAEHEYRNGLEIVKKTEIDEHTKLLLGWSERGNFIGLELAGQVRQELYFNEGYDGFLIDLRAWRIGESFDYLVVGSFGEEDGTTGLQVFYLHELQRLEHWQELSVTGFDSEGEVIDSIPEDGSYFTASVLPDVRLAMHGENSFSLSLHKGWYQVYVDDYPQWIDNRITLSFSSQDWQLRFPRLQSDR